ncbi:sensor histidine kinase [Plantactinospora sp. WMMC1484]|uniref:sensor histidine kinase n=1 Tax=Plantactinospora sp. WMMC1484 TaxID=3404122 RepID=UPI003BF5B8EC
MVTSAWTGHRAYPVGLLLGGLAVWGGAVAVRRRLPLVPLFAVVLLCTLDGNYCLGLPLVSYLLGRRTVRIWPAAVSFSALAVLGTPLVLSGSGFVSWVTMAGALVYAGLFPWLIGRYRRLQRALVAAGWEQAEQLEREQRMLAREVRLRERARIAEDMHDSLGHELSLLALRAGALELAPGLDERTRAVAGGLRAGAATATGQLREIIDVLRDDPVTGELGVDPVSGDLWRGPGPTHRRGSESVAELVDRARAAGMPVELHPTGAGPHATGAGPQKAGAGPQKAGCAGQLPPLVERVAYRVVQESLTNANKHAPGARVIVRLSPQHDGTLLVSVWNALPGGADRTAPGTPGGGRGLVGLHEGVRLAGGTLQTGERDGGFEVVARLPRHSTDGNRPGMAWTPVPVPTAPTPAPASVSAADRQRLLHREARRGLVAATLVLTTLAMTLGGAALGYYLYATSNSVLTPGRYAELRVGQDWADVLPSLPRREMLDPPDPDPLSVPSGAECRYYRSHGEVLQPRLDVYRLCAAQGRLVTKDALPIR